MVNHLIKLMNSLNINLDTIFDFDFNSQEFESEFESELKKIVKKTENRKIYLMHDSETEIEIENNDLLNNKFIDLYKYLGVEIDVSVEKINLVWNKISTSKK